MRQLALLFATLLSLCAGEPVLVDAGVDATAWHFHNGGEFPGARGSLAVEDQGLALTWDFSAGGAYVSATHQGPFPPGTDAFTVAVETAATCTVRVRLSDRSGRTMQSQTMPVEGGAGRTLTITRAGPWADGWGGRNGAALGDLTGVTLLINKEGSPATGRLALRRLAAQTAAPVAYPVALPDLAATLAGWKVTGRWHAQWSRPVFAGLAERVDGGDGDLAVTLPRLGRDWVQRTALRGRAVPLRLALPLADGGNPRAVYRLPFAVTTATERAERVLTLTGVHSAGVNLGQPRRSADLPPNVFGTCLHLDFGRSGAFAGWADHERLLDEVAACGLTWIRDGVTAEKDASGAWQVDPYDLGWLKLAQARKLKPIVEIRMEAKQPVVEFAAMAAAIARQVQPFAAVIELGNEPNNFGGWRDKHGGPWNGREPDGSTSPWVKAHLAATNAGAEAVRAACPKATILALGSCTPTNFLAMDLGLSPAVDGIVDHPYTYCMPPEKIPYGHATTARDGVQVGDKQHTFVGLIRSIRAKSAATGKARDVWVTEFGWTCYQPDGSNEKGLYAGFSEQAQAAYLLRRWILSLSLGIPASCQYDLLDDYRSAPGKDEANFGLLRGDYSRKPSFFAAQRMCALFSGLATDSTATVTVQAPLHHSMQAVRTWDGADKAIDNAVIALPFLDAQHPAERTLALWSAQPWSGEFQPRHVAVRITGWGAFAAPPLAVDLLTGACCDVPCTREGEALIVKLNLGQAPLALRFFKD